ncbi:MAG TPA: 6-pyruvoyl-tetrahydropterin synthase-related protein, partial [Thermoplasmata archaeon]|nr:6-pyruvoyl-tetrahydropterin synthase-related protein [Thermoplasmata archaeon]
MAGPGASPASADRSRSPAPVGPARPSATPVPPPRPPSRLRRILRYWMPPTSGRPRRPDGLLSDPGPDLPAWGVALGLAVFTAVMFEWFANIAPIPPGGDESQWLLLSYPYVGITAPSQIALLSYPPISFPFLGLCVLVTQSPLTGARLFAGLLVAAMGLSMYHLGRSMFRMRSVALLVEGAFLFQPDFQQLYYFGAYPNMFGFVFFFLAVSFALRFLRSRRPTHLALFWTCVTLAVLSHALVGVLLVGLLLCAGALLLLYRRLPRELFTTVAGVAGLAVVVASAFLYYEGSVLFGVNSPNYLTTTVLTSQKSTLQLQATLKAFYLENLSKLFRGSGFHQSYTLALQILWELTIAIVGVLLLARLLVPREVSHRVIVLAAWFLSVFDVALATWYVGLTADYRRFAYFLYPPAILLVGLGADVVILALWEWLARRPQVLAAAKAGLPDPPRAARRRWRWRRWDRPQAVVGVIVAVGGVFLLACFDIYTTPAAEAFARSFTSSGHDASFVAVMGTVAHSGLGGSILSATAAVDRWPATLTGRNLYEARSPTGFTYSTENLVQDELATMGLSYRYAVTNGLVLGGIPGTNSTDFTAAPVYALYVYGISRPIFKIDPTTVIVTTAGGQDHPIWSATGGTHRTIDLPTDPNNATISIVYTGPGFAVTETISAIPGTASLGVNFTARATGPTDLVGLRFKIVSATSGFNSPYLNGTTPGRYSWF